MKTVRIIKACLVLQLGLFALLVAINNVTDYGSNFAFVQHVLSMDTTFEGNALMWRSIDAPIVHHVFYMLIICAEFICGAICSYASLILFRSRENNQGFEKAKALAAIGLCIGISLWFTGFMTVGAEWFLMWQSQIWNGQAAASRFIAMLFFTLIFLFMPEENTRGYEHTK